MLRNVNELSYYVLQASDGQIGRCKDFLFSEKDWAIRYMVADTRKWLPGRKVILSPGLAYEISWRNRHVAVDRTREQVKHAPEFNASLSLDRGYETRLHKYYDMPPYWE